MDLSCRGRTRRVARTSGREAHDDAAMYPIERDPNCGKGSEAGQSPAAGNVADDDFAAGRGRGSGRDHAPVRTERSSVDSGANAGEGRVLYPVVVDPGKDADRPARIGRGRHRFGIPDREGFAIGADRNGPGAGVFPESAGEGETLGFERAARVERIMPSRVVTATTSPFAVAEMSWGPVALSPSGASAQVRRRPVSQSHTCRTFRLSFVPRLLLKMATR